jgi:glycosyltransferase involved in cell wall biosynthesis
MSDLKISVITPSYNQGEFIEDTITSIRDQAYSNFEHIIFDGGSTDSTKNILKKYKHIDWVSEKDRGQTNAINKGLKKASGEILCYLNSDDLFLPDTLEFVADYFSRNKDVDLIYGNCIFVDNDLNIIKTRKSEDFNLKRLLYLGYSYIQQPSTFFRRSVLEEVGFFDEALDYVMDYDYWIRVGKSGKTLQYVDKDLSMMRIHTGAKTFADNKKMFKEAFAVSGKYGGRKILRYYLHYSFWYILNTIPGLFKFLFNLRNRGKIK